MCLLNAFKLPPEGLFSHKDAHYCHLKYQQSVTMAKKDGIDVNDGVVLRKSLSI